MSLNKNYLIADGKSLNGKGVFAGKDFTKGEKIIQFQGDLIYGDNCPDEDHSVQIGKELYMGPAGGIDDLFNHSCQPNAWLKIERERERERAVLYALKKIKKGKEVVWDYSTTMEEDNWEMACHCRAKNCRKLVRDFKYLPKNIQNRYIKLGIVSKYCLDAMRKYNEN